jgi:hypothetical protein
LTLASAEKSSTKSPLDGGTVVDGADVVVTGTVVVGATVVAVVGGTGTVVVGATVVGAAVVVVAAGAVVVVADTVVVAATVVVVVVTTGLTGGRLNSQPTRGAAVSDVVGATLLRTWTLSAPVSTTLSVAAPEPVTPAAVAIDCHESPCSTT